MIQNNMHRNITKSKFFYTILGIHVLCGILGLTILCSVPETDQIRWNIGYIIGYLFVLSLIFSFLYAYLIKYLKESNTAYGYIEISICSV